MRKYKTLSSCAVIGLAATLLLTLPSCQDAKLKSTEEELAPVMSIGGYDVPYELYRYVAMNYRAQYESGLDEQAAAELWLGDDGAALLTELNDNTDETLQNLYVTISLAAEYDLTPDSALISENVATRIDEIYEGYENDTDAYLADIQPHYMNDSVYRFLIQNDVLTEELFYAMLNASDILSDPDTLSQMIHSDECIRVKQILIAADNGNSKAENRATAEKLYEQLQNGADFEELLGEYGEDLYMWGNDDGYYILRGNRYEAFEDAAYALQIGEYSKVIETDAGYSILMRYEKDEQYLDTHFDELCQEYFDSAYNALLQAHLPNMTIEKFPLLDEYTIFTME